MPIRLKRYIHIHRSVRSSSDFPDINYMVNRQSGSRRL